jgi:hypothetical protein
MKCALIFALIAFSVPTLSQTQKATGKATYQFTENERLEFPVFWNAETVRMFKDSDVDMKYTLTTSWIPGPDHKGMFRYKMGVAPLQTPERVKDAPELYTPNAIENLMKRAHRCIISVDLYDVDGFIVRRFDVGFSFGTNSSAQIVGLTANDFIQMDAAEYKKLTASGAWSVGWLCDPTTPQ